MKIDAIDQIIEIKGVKIPAFSDAKAFDIIQWIEQTVEEQP